MLDPTKENVVTTTGTTIKAKYPHISISASAAETMTSYELISSIRGKLVRTLRTELRDDIGSGITDIRDAEKERRKIEDQVLKFYDGATDLALDRPLLIGFIQKWITVA